MVPESHNLNQKEKLLGFFVFQARIAASLFPCKHLHLSGKQGNRDSKIPTSLLSGRFSYFQGLII